jgi:hypothetical protein
MDGGSRARMFPPFNCSDVIGSATRRMRREEEAPGATGVL